MIKMRQDFMITADRTNDLLKDLLELTKKVVLVGVPEASGRADVRKEERATKGQAMGNASLAYIHDNGSPLANIPARPFMKPGIAKVQEQINKELALVAKESLDKKEDRVDQHLHRAGLIASASIKNIINEGAGFTPLKRGTLLGRLRRRKAAKKWDKEKREEIMESMHPLIDTGQLRNSISYVIEKKT